MEVLSRYYQKMSSMSVLVFGTNNKIYVEKDYYLYSRCPSGYRNMVNSHNMADIGTCQTIQLLHLFGGMYCD